MASPALVSLVFAGPSTSMSNCSSLYAAISIDFRDTFEPSKELRITLDNNTPRCLRGDGKDRRLRWPIDPTMWVFFHLCDPYFSKISSEMWPGSNLTVQPLKHRTGIRRRHGKSEPICISAEDLINGSNLLANAPGSFSDSASNLLLTSVNQC